MKKAFTVFALAALMFAGAGLAGCASGKCCDGNPACEKCAGKGDAAACEGCKAAGGMCEACKAKAK
jgi:hypothetical protein